MRERLVLGERPFTVGNLSFWRSSATASANCAHRGPRHSQARHVGRKRQNGMPAGHIVSLAGHVAVTARTVWPKVALPQLWRCAKIMD
jgi:hypothetical protein